MRYLFFILSVGILSGCGYSYSELEAAKLACKNYKGSFGVSRVGDLITKTTCTVDGITYRIGRTQYQLHEGRIQ